MSRLPSSARITAVLIALALIGAPVTEAQEKPASPPGFDQIVERLENGKSAAERLAAAEDLQALGKAAIPAIVEVPTDTESRVFDLTEELIADGLTYGLPYIQITAVFKPSLDPPATPSLEGWSFEFFCEAAE